MTEFEKRRHRVCFTGHRPEKLTRSEETIRKDLEIQICQAVADGLNVFITGMARGVDIWAAQIVLMLRDEGYDVKLMCACPYDGFEQGWSQKWQRQYKAILAAADFVKYVCGATVVPVSKFGTSGWSTIPPESSPYLTVKRVERKNDRLCG